MKNVGPEGSEPRRGDDDNLDPAGTRNEVGGVVFGTSLQARDIKGGLHVHPPVVRLISFRRHVG